MNNGAVIIKVILLNAGDKAGTKNEPRLLSSPIVKASSDINIKNGNMKRVKREAMLAVSASKPGAMMRVKISDPNIPSVTTINAAINKTLIALRANLKAALILSRSKTCENTGTKAADNAPSANNCRAKFASV